MNPTKCIRFNNYLSKLRKEGIITAERSRTLAEKFIRVKDISEIMDEIILLEVKEEKRSWFEAFIDQLISDPVLN